MLNLAGPAYDYGQVLYAVLAECEHQRRALAPEETAARLRRIAREKLAEIFLTYRECGGTEPYWAELAREVNDTAMPQYVEAAIEKNRLERAAYDLWRRGDPVARGAIGLGGLTLGGILVALPFIPIWEDSFAFALGLGGLFYPEIKRWIFDFRHTRALNRLISQADRYQKNRQLHYLSEHLIETELEEALHPPLHAAEAEAQRPPWATAEPEGEKAAPAGDRAPSTSPGTSPGGAGATPTNGTSAASGTSAGTLPAGVGAPSGVPGAHAPVPAGGATPPAGPQPPLKFPQR